MDLLGLCFLLVMLELNLNALGSGASRAVAISRAIQPRQSHEDGPLISMTQLSKGVLLVSRTLLGHTITAILVQVLQWVVPSPVRQLVWATVQFWIDAASALARSSLGVQVYSYVVWILNLLLALITWALVVLSLWTQMRMLAATAAACAASAIVAYLLLPSVVWAWIVFCFWRVCELGVSYMVSLFLSWRSASAAQASPPSASSAPMLDLASSSRTTSESTNSAALTTAD